MAGSKRAVTGSFPPALRVATAPHAEQGAAVEAATALRGSDFKPLESQGVRASCSTTRAGTAQGCSRAVCGIGQALASHLPTNAHWRRWASCILETLAPDIERQGEYSPAALPSADINRPFESLVVHNRRPACRRH